MKRIFCLSLVFALLASPQKLWATHAAGMDISYACYGNNLYQFYVTFYRDCIGIAAPPSMKMYLSSENCAYLDSFSMNLVYSTQGSDTISHLAGLCPDAVSQCAGGTYTGYEQYIYAVNVTLPMVCDDWTASTYIEFRNNAITNLVNPGQQRLYVECHLSNVDGLCDNSPLFSNVPLAYSCVHEQFLYNHGAYDPDGDSLVYTLVNPLNGANDPIDYVSLFLGPEYPLYTEDGTFGFDPFTGQMSCVPDAVQIVVISVLIDEYRNGLKIGSTQRDLQVVIKTCSNNLPEIPLGIQNLEGGVLIDDHTVQVCPGSLVDFDLIGTDLDADDVLSMSTNLPLVIPDATFTVDGVNPDTTHVQWQTSITDTGFYVFTVTVKDNACPLVGSQIYSFTIQIGTPAVDAGADIRTCITNPEAELQVIGLPPFLWNNAQYLDDPTSPNPTATLPGLGIYEFIVTADVGGFCENTDTVLVTVDPDFNSSSSVFPDTVCAGQEVTLLATASGGVGGYSYEWISVNGGYSDTSASAVDTPGLTTTYVAIIESGGCTHFDTATVIVHPIPSSFFVGDTSICVGGTSEFTYAGGNISGLTFDWNFSGGTVLSGSGAGPYEVLWSNAGVYSVSLTVMNEFGCSSTYGRLVGVHVLPVAQFTANTIGCDPLTVAFVNQSTGAFTYSWSFGDGSVSNETNPTHIYTEGTYSVSLITTSIYGCSDEEIKTDFIQVLPVPEACATVDEDLSHAYDLSQSTFHFQNCSENATTYYWDFGDSTFSSDENPVHTYTAIDTFMVTLTASNGYCSDTAQIGPIKLVLIDQVYFPLAFSPNGDGHNDFFHELGGIGVTDLHYSVYNRWGEMIYVSNDIQSVGWDGTYKGVDCEIGVYVWVASATFINGKQTSVSGNLTLIR